VAIIVVAVVVSILLDASSWEAGASQLTALDEQVVVVRSASKEARQVWKCSKKKRRKSSSCGNKTFFSACMQGVYSATKQSISYMGIAWAIDRRRAS
jgi:hypothetical protein